MSEPEPQPCDDITPHPAATIGLCFPLEWPTTERSPPEKAACCYS